MRLLLITTIAAATVSATPYSYWVHESCDRPGFAAGFNEFKTMALKAHNRLNSVTDTDFAAVFKRIFKVEVTDVAAYNQVTGRETPTSGKSK